MQLGALGAGAERPEAILPAVAKCMGLKPGNGGGGLERKIVRGDGVAEEKNDQRGGGERKAGTWNKYEKEGEPWSEEKVE